MKFHHWVLNCISQSQSKETDLAIVSRHVGQICGRTAQSTVSHTNLRLVCVRLSSRHTSLNYSALLAGSRGSRTSIFFNPSAVLSLVGFVLQQCQGWATDSPELGLGTIDQNTRLIWSSCDVILKNPNNKSRIASYHKHLPPETWKSAANRVWNSIFYSILAAWPTALFLPMLWPLHYTMRLIKKPYLQSNNHVTLVKALWGRRALHFSGSHFKGIDVSVPPLVMKLQRGTLGGSLFFHLAHS